MKSSFSQIIVKNELSPSEIIKKILLADTSGISITDVKYIGSDKSIGVFYSATNFLPITKGVVLSTGIAENIDGPNDSNGMGSMRFTPGDPDLEKVAKNNTADAAILEFTFYPNTDKISFNYFFASEEYPEFVNHGVNDVFAFFISGPGIDGQINLAMLPNLIDPVTVDHVNEHKNSEYFIANRLWSSDNLKGELSELELSYSFQFDGLTTLLEASMHVIPYQPYKLKFAIADVGDNVYDSGVFLKAKSFKSKGEKIPFVDLIKKELNEFKLDGNMESYKIIDDKAYIHSNIQFDFNSFEILDEYFYSLDYFAKIMMQYFDLNITLIGHTDDVGSELYNMELSIERSTSIKKYLVARGIHNERIKIEGKGKTEPILTDTLQESRVINRRVEFVIEKY
ncbi:MAG: OmpA family protein [Salinivirgaceae bacterium]|nr:OmpA family protein [Salinivirgaceae bacterium]